MPLKAALWLFASTRHSHPLRTVESLRLLSNLETEKRKLRSWSFWDSQSWTPNWRSRRSASSCNGSPLPSTWAHGRRAGGVYLRHRLHTAASDDHTDLDVFEPAAVAPLRGLAAVRPAHQCAGP